jgi:hypothetical protein
MGSVWTYGSHTGSLSLGNKMGLKATLDLGHGILEQHKIPHALIGGIALSFWGVHRATSDIDFLVHGDFSNQALSALRSVGFQMHFQSDEVMQFLGIGALDLLLARRPLSKKMLSDAKCMQPSGVPCLLPEDIIGLKIQAYKNNPRREFQDKADIQSLFGISSQIDMERVRNYAALFGEEEEINKLWKIAKSGNTIGSG